jgi:hypothetical protein
MGGEPKQMMTYWEELVISEFQKKRETSTIFEAKFTF